MSYFMSTGKLLEYTFEDGIFFIRGENKSSGQEGQNNGVGKTNIFFDSLVFALYGEISRKDVSKSDIPFNKGGKKKCFVDLKFNLVEGDKTIPCRIYRSINPSKVILEIDGEDKSQSNARSTQEYFVNTVLKGIKKEVFMQSMAMKADSNSFFSMGKPEREKFIGTIFDFTYIKEAEKLARDEYNKKAKEVSEKKTQIEVKEPQIDTIKRQIQTAKKELDEKKKIKEQELKSVQEKIDRFDLGEEPEEIDLEKESEKFNKLIDKAQEVILNKKEEFGNVSLEIKTRKSKISDNNNSIKRKEEARVCSECNREIEEEQRKKLDTDCHRLEQENSAIADYVKEQETLAISLTKTIKSYEDKLKVVKTKQSLLTSKVSKNQKEIATFKNNERELQSFKDRAVALSEEIKQPDDSSILKALISDYKQANVDLKVYQTEFTNLESELDVLYHVKIVFSEKGLRSSILGKLIDLFNSSLNNYLRKFRSSCEVEFNENMEYSIKTLGGTEQVYGLFSGGEKWRINTALFLTFSDILRIQNQIAFNVKLVDEFFDGAVDKSGLDIISDILVQRQEEYGENVLVITHKTEFDIPIARVINVVKEKGISRIESIE